MSASSLRSVPWQPIARTIRQANTDLKKEFKPWARSWIQEYYKIRDGDVNVVLQRAQNALWQSVCKGDNWHPNLPWQMIADQMLVYSFHHGDPPADWQEPFKALAGRYLKRRMSSQYKGEDLDIDQETVRDRALKVIEDELLREKFILTSTLYTFFIGILRRSMLDGIRSRKKWDDHKVRYSDRHQPNTSAPKPTSSLVPVEVVQFYQRAHLLITRALLALENERCQQLIIHHYGLSRDRLSEVASLPDETGPVSETDFRARFNVAMQEPGPIGSLRELASTIVYEGKPYSQKNVSKHHLDCKAKLVVAVVPHLATDPALREQGAVRRLLDKQLTEAQTRINKRRQWK